MPDSPLPDLILYGGGGHGKSLIDLLRPYGIKELARTGVIAMARGQQPAKEDADASKNAGGKRVRSINAAAAQSLPPS